MRPAERSRAEGSSNYQHNRNPFVDHPEWIEAVYGAVFKLTANSTSTTLTITDAGGQRTATVSLTPAPRYYRLKLTTRPG